MNLSELLHHDALNALRNANALEPVVALTAVIVGGAVILLAAKVSKLWDSVLGNRWRQYIRGRAMGRKMRFKREVQEAIEDLITDAFTEAVASKRITLDDARELYARMAHLGFWGLHPRKFQVKKSPLDLQLLKEEIKQRRAARTASEKTTADLVSQFLGDVD